MPPYVAAIKQNRQFGRPKTALQPFKSQLELGHLVVIEYGRVESDLARAFGLRIQEISFGRLPRCAPRVHERSSRNGVERRVRNLCAKSCLSSN